MAADVNVNVIGNLCDLQRAQDIASTHIMRREMTWLTSWKLPKVCEAVLPFRASKCEAEKRTATCSNAMPQSRTREVTDAAGRCN